MKILSYTTLVVGILLLLAAFAAAVISVWSTAYVEEFQGTAFLSTVTGALTTIVGIFLVDEV